MPNDWTSAGIHEETRELAEDIKPPWMGVSGFVDGCVWMFYGHLAHGKSRLTPSERRAIYRLRQSGVQSQVLADAFGVNMNTIRGVQEADARLRDGDSS